MEPATSPLVQNLPAAVHVEPVTIFHYEVLAVADDNQGSKVAKLTTQMLYMTFCLMVVAIINFVIDLSQSSVSITSAVLNLLIALSLPACGYIGVRDKNINCIQYFCCCTHFCACLAILSFFSAVILVAVGQNSYISSIVLFAFFFVVYWQAGRISQRLANEPYFTADRVNPSQLHHVHNNTVEFSPQPVAEVRPVALASFATATSVPMPNATSADFAPPTIVVVGQPAAPNRVGQRYEPTTTTTTTTAVPGEPLGTPLDSGSSLDSGPLARPADVGGAAADTRSNKKRPVSRPQTNPTVNYI